MAKWLDVIVYNLEEQIVNKEIISDKHAIALLAFILVGDKLIFAMSIQAKKDFWLAIILALIICVPIFLIFARLHVLFPRKNLFAIIESVMGKFLGKILILFFVLYVGLNSALIIDAFTRFITTVSLFRTPQAIPAIVIMFLCAWVVKEGIEVMSRFALLFFILMSSIVFIAAFLLIPEMKINNLRPMLNEGIKPIIEGAINTFGFPLTESVMFIMIFTSSKKRNSPYKIYISVLLISGVLLLMTSISEVLVLGINGYTNLYFTGYSAVLRINIGGFIQRLEILAATTFVIGGFAKLSICLLAVTNGVSKLFNFSSNRFCITPITLLLINVSLFVTSSIMHLFAWAEEIWTKFAFTFQVILPIIIWIVAEIRKKRVVNN